jgi:hypothetical protein
MISKEIFDEFKETELYVEYVRRKEEENESQKK